MAARRAPLRLLLFGLLLIAAGLATGWALSGSPTPPAPPAPGEPAEPVLSAADLEAGRLTEGAFLRQGKDGRRLYRSAIGPVGFRSSFVKEGSAASRRALGRAIARVQRAGIVRGEETDGWFWRPFAPIGGYLTDEDRAYWVLPGALLARREVAPRDRDAQRQALVRAITGFVEAIGAAEGLTPWMAGALKDFVQRLDDEPGDPSGAELDGDFARRVASSHGWLARVAPGVDASARLALEQALSDALALAPELIVEGDDHRLTIYGNLWGSQGSLFDAPDRGLFIRTPPRPMDASNRAKALGRCRLCYELPAGADPVHDPLVVGRTEAAVFFEGQTVLATWSGAAGFEADKKTWRAHFPARKGVYARGGFPPHIPIQGPDGTLYGLALPGGVLRPVTDDSDMESDRFLVDAARLLPDAAHLDLLQQYFVRYTADSPDVTCPQMIGCDAYCDDIHQTAEQILDTCARGICRGDCDDFAEFGQAVLLRQGKLAHVINLPEHLATLWAERHAGRWHVYVLQSGPTLEFTHESLPDALERAYVTLDETVPFDRNGVSLSLRFEGQNTREPFRLSWRIFEDAEYAALMTDVQADWNRMTLLRAIGKMKRVIAEGDHSNANYSELAGLFLWTHQMDAAIVNASKALERREDPESRLLLSVELAGHFADAKRLEEAEAHTRHILKVQLPALSDHLGLRTLVVGVDLASDLSDEAPALAAHALAETAALRVGDLGGSLSALLKPDAHPDAVRAHGEFDALGSIMRSYLGTAIAIAARLKEAGVSSPDASRMMAPLEVWLAYFHVDSLEDAEDLAGAWSTLAHFFRLASGDGFLGRVAAAPMPASREEAAQMIQEWSGETVLSLARASTWFVTGEIDGLVADEEKRPDPADVRRLARMLDEAEAAAKRLGVYGSGAEADIRETRIRLALLSKDEAGLRRLLREVKHLEDRHAFSATSAALGWMAVHLDMPWWRKAFGVWVEEIDNRVNYFNVVWRAVGMGAKEQALHAAEVAAKRYPDDDALQEEARLLRAHLAN